MKFAIGIATTLICTSLTAFSAVTVNWAGGGTALNLYDSNGTMYTGSDFLIQLVVDVNGDTDFAQFESTGMLGIGSETDYGGVMSTASDDTFGSWATGFWIDTEALGNPTPGEFLTGDSGGVGTVSSGVDDTYGSSQFYFRWFNADTASAATEVGYIWDTSWTTPVDALATPTTVSIGYEDMGATGGGTQNGSTGWATVQPVPEPGTMALFALGLATLGVSRRRRKVQA